MKYEELPKEMQEAFDNLHHTFSSIKCEVEDALEEAENLENFKELVASRMKDIHDEAENVANQFAKDHI